MMKHILTAIFSIFLLSCNRSTKKTEVDCMGTRDLQIGQIEVSLPRYYELYFPDSVEINHMFLAKGKNCKLEINTDGLASLKAFEGIENNNSTNVSTDTLDNCMRQIGSIKKNNNYSFFVNIIDLNRQSETIFTLFNKDTVSNSLSDKRYYVKLLMGTTQGTELSKNDIDILTNAFKNSKISNKK